MAMNTIFQHDISAFRLESYTPDNNHCVGLLWNMAGHISSDLSLFFVSEAEAMPLVRGMASEQSVVRLPDGQRPLLDWLASRDAIAAIEAERERAAIEADTWDGMLEGSNAED